MSCFEFKTPNRAEIAAFNTANYFYVSFSLCFLVFTDDKKINYNQICRIHHFKQLKPSRVEINDFISMNKVNVFICFLPLCFRLRHVEDGPSNKLTNLILLKSASRYSAKGERTVSCWHAVKVLLCSEDTSVCSLVSGCCPPVVKFKDDSFF